MRAQTGKTKRTVARQAAIIATWLACLLPLASPSAWADRIKDLASVQGIRNNQLVGYGLVAGLDGTGDQTTQTPFTTQSIINMLAQLGTTLPTTQSLQLKNVAAVMVTATLPPFSAQGSKLDVTVATMGDAKSLQGGVLMVTPLQGADGEVYAVAQGTISSGITATGQSGSSVTKGVPTAGRIASGAIVEREINFHLADMTVMRLALRNPDFTTARRVADVINKHMPPGTAEAVDSATVRINIPAERKGDIVGMMTEIEQLQVVPDQIARVVIDEASGVIVMGENVRINTVAIAQGNLTIRINEMPQVSQPAPLSKGGQTTVVPHSEISVDESKDKKLALLNSGVTLQELVQSLNALGIGPRDMITILQSIKAAGALQADLEVL